MANLLFSTDAEFEITLRAGGKKAVVRFPTDEEWTARSRSIKTVIVRYGSGTQTRTEGVEAADAELLAKIMKDSPDTFDEFEANALIGKLTKAETSEATAVPEGYEIPVTVIGGIKTTHTLRVPSEKELRAYRKAAFMFVDQRHGKQELKTNPAAVGEFYDKLVVKGTGYLPPSMPPLCHRMAAIIELTQTVDALDEDSTESFI